ncbi:MULTISPECIES: nitrous oxide reductase accessory protein NosL [Bacillus]|uniref:nitrous oxide reductase accessory protein NosL n=1 Tax=Bacillus TaxID=1386 RepID=UPI0003196987|nr:MULTISPECIES: nitrous oxide reductase accessory protein NosL [Bacillus]
MRKLVSSFMILGTFFMLSACGKEPSYKPVAINPEVDVCDLCNMSLVEENDVTELFSKDGDVYKFDDIGCMFEFVHKDKGIAEKDIAKQYVRDMESGKWIEVEKAYFAYDSSFPTPMSYGVLSFEKKEAANDYIKRENKGEVLDYKKLEQHKWGWEQ